MDSTYTTYIYERYKSLKDSNKGDFDNYDLSKIFEYYTALKLKEKYNKNFYEYNDIKKRENYENPEIFFLTAAI